MSSGPHMPCKVLSFTLAAALIAVGAASGCGKADDTSSSSTPTSSSSAPPSAASAPKPASASSSAKPDGAALFTQNCAGCHGDQGAGGKKAPKLAGRHTPEAEVTQVVANGKGRMPPFKGRLQTDQIAALAKYVATL